jgi:hypothetical protein
MSTTDIKERISAMGYLFVVAAEGLVVDLSIAAVDSNLIKAKGSILYGTNHPIWRKKGSSTVPGHQYR